MILTLDLDVEKVLEKLNECKLEDEAPITADELARADIVEVIRGWFDPTAIIEQANKEGGLTGEVMRKLGRAGEDDRG